VCGVRVLAQLRVGGLCLLGLWGGRGVGGKLFVGVGLWVGGRDRGGGGGGVVL